MNSRVLFCLYIRKLLDGLVDTNTMPSIQQWSMVIIPDVSIETNINWFKTNGMSMNLEHCYVCSLNKENYFDSADDFQVRCGQCSSSLSFIVIENGESKNHCFGWRLLSWDICSLGIYANQCSQNLLKPQYKTIFLAEWLQVKQAYILEK